MKVYYHYVCNIHVVQHERLPHPTLNALLIWIIMACIHSF